MWNYNDIIFNRRITLILKYLNISLSYSPIEKIKNERGWYCIHVWDYNFTIRNKLNKFFWIALLKKIN